MIDPYSVLNIDRNADDAEIKKAYRALSKKYHPDNNIDNPNKKDAEEKFKQIQAAYDQIMNERKNGGSGEYRYDGNPFADSFGFGGGTYTNSSTDEYTRDLQSAATYINNGYYNEALHVLNEMKDRDDKWYYFSAIANLGTGNNVTALNYAKKACILNPDEPSYQELVYSIENGKAWYGNRQRNYGYKTMNFSNGCYDYCCMAAACSLCSGGGGFYFFPCI